MFDNHTRTVLTDDVLHSISSQMVIGSVLSWVKHFGLPDARCSRASAASCTGIGKGCEGARQAPTQSAAQSLGCSQSLCRVWSFMFTFSTSALLPALASGIVLTV